MAEENVRRLKDAYAAFAEGDLGPVLELCDERIEVVEPAEIPDSSTFEGPSGVVAVLSKLEDVFPDFVFEAYDFAAHENRVLVSIRWRGSGMRSGTPGETSLFHLWTFDGRKATRVEGYLDRTEALEAAGLRA
jgi:ketosteroid isomerase-like protein